MKYSCTVLKAYLQVSCGNSFAVECTLEKEVRLFEMAVPKESVGFYMELGFVQMELVALQAYIKHDAWKLLKLDKK